MSKVLTKFKSDDDAVNRFQDQLLGVLNPILKSLPDGIGNAPTVTGATGGNAALVSLVKALASMGLIKDGTT